jgi:hypothetical protein
MMKKRGMDDENSLFGKEFSKISYEATSRSIFAGLGYASFVEPLRKTLPHYLDKLDSEVLKEEQGTVYYTKLLAAMASEVSPFYNDEVFKIAKRHINKKLKEIKESEKTQWTMQQAACILIYKKIEIKTLADANKYGLKFKYSSATSGRKLKEIYKKFKDPDYRIAHFQEIKEISSALNSTARERFSKEQAAWLKKSVKKM